MAALHLLRETPAAPPAVWEALTDFAAYGSWMPLTRMRLDPGPPRVGWGFAGHSGIGRLSFRDSMLVTAWSPPVGADAGTFRVVKTGWLLGGWAEVTVRPSEHGTRVVWDEELSVRPLPFPRLFASGLRRVGQWLYGRALDAMLAEAVRRGQRR
jgi:uncharacterized protein YndB with AHSA1/START domain